MNIVNPFRYKQGQVESYESPLVFQPQSIAEIPPPTVVRPQFQASRPLSNHMHNDLDICCGGPK